MSIEVDWFQSRLALTGKSPSASLSLLFNKNSEALISVAEVGCPPEPGEAGNLTIESRCRHCCAGDRREPSEDCVEFPILNAVIPRCDRTVSSVASGPGDVGRNMLLTALSNFLVPLSALVTAPILAQSLGVDGRGSMAAVIAPVVLFTTVATLGLPEAATFWVAKRPAFVRIILRRATLLLIASGLVATTLSVAAAHLVSAENTDLIQLIQIASIAIFPTVVIGALRGTAAGLHQWGLVNGERYAGAAIRLFGVIVLSIDGILTPATAVAVMALAPVIAGLVYFRLRCIEMPTDVGNDDVPTRDLLGYGIRIWIGSFSGILLSRIDQVLITPLSSTFQLGLYAAAVTVSEATLLANNAVRDVTLAADANDSIDERIMVSSRISFIVSIAVGLGLGLTLPLWFEFVFGAGFHEAIPVTGVLIVAAVLGVPGSVGGAGLSARGRPELRSMGLVVAAALNIGLLFAWVPVLGAMGAALATLAGNLIAANMNLIFLRRYFGIRIWDCYAVRPSDLQTLSRVARRVLKRE